MNIFDTLEEISGKDGLAYLVIGGHAVSAYGYSRVTGDLDILVARNDRDAWLASLVKHGFKLFHDGGVFLQTTPPEGCRWPLDLMLVNERSFGELLGGSRVIEQGGNRLRVPSLDHLIALKLHTLKQGLQHRGFKDFMDILSLAQANALDIRSDNFRALCEKYASKAIYERIVAFQS
jgi:hypothetical protein